MAKIKKKQTSAGRFAPAIKAMALCLLIGGSGVGYVRQKNEIYALSEKFRRGEVQLEKLRTENRERANKLESLQAPRALEVRVKAMNLGLIAPRPDQIVRLSEMPPDASLSGGGKLFAGSEGGGGVLMNR